MFLGEDKFLQQLAIEEQFGVTIEEKEHQKEKLSEKKGTGVAIGYNYSDPGAQPSNITGRFHHILCKLINEDLGNGMMFSCLEYIYGIQY